MASRRFDNLQTLGMKRVQLTGSFRPNGTGSVLDVTGLGFTVARTSTGLYTVTFADIYHSFVGAIAGMRVATNTPTLVQGGDWDSTARTLQIRTFQGSPAALGLGYINLPIDGLRQLATNDYLNLAGVGGILATDSTPLIQRVNGATDISARVVWAATVVDEVQWAGIAYPPDIDDTANVTVNLLVSKDTNTDTAAVIGVKAFEGIGDANMGGDTSALSVATLTKKTVTLTGANIGTYPNFMNIALVPGAHANDAVRLHAAWLEYTRTGTAAAYALTDLSADVDNEIEFSATFVNTSA